MSAHESGKASSFKSVEEIDAIFKQLEDTGGDISISAILRIMDQQTHYQRPFSWAMSSMVSFIGIGVLCCVLTPFVPPFFREWAWGAGLFCFFVAAVAAIYARRDRPMIDKEEQESLVIENMALDSLVRIVKAKKYSGARLDPLKASSLRRALERTRRQDEALMLLLSFDKPSAHDLKYAKMPDL